MIASAADDEIDSCTSAIAPTVLRFIELAGDSGYDFRGLEKRFYNFVLTKYSGTLGLFVK